MGFLLKIGETFAGGRVEKEVGESSSSEVYLVSHPGRGHLAIKVFKRIEQDPDQLKPLLDKARIQQQFRHKNIVRIFDAGMNEHHLGDLGCIAMEYFPGGSLATLLDSRRANQGKRLSARKTVEIIEQICNGLSAFHGAGHVHGDIKPENILVDLVNKRTDEVRYCVADFGLGKAGDPTTEFYQPPERFREERTDSFASDVWAVGVICYQLLTLEFPFRVKEFLPQGRDPFDEGLKPASGINRSVNPSLDEIIAKALCADPDQRYQTATELLAALGQWRHSLPGTERYRVMEKDDGGNWELGHGAMGITYKAYDTRIGRYVALKVIKEASLASESARERFLREAQLAGRLRHPNVAVVHDFGSYFYVSELIDGHTVDEHVRKNGPFQPVEALEIALQVARALSAAARMSLIHRDLKPANIMLEVDDEGKQVVKVIDFGLAKSLIVTEEESGTMGLTAGFVGTPQYASPEQVKNREMDIRSDIYSLGVTIYFMLTGRPPFRGELFEIFRQIVETPVPLEPLKDSPPQVIALVQRLMAKDPGERPETPKILVDEIQACIREIAKLGPIKLEAGEILAQKYRLIEETEPGPAVRKFLAEDLQTSRRVNILILSPEFLSKSDGLNTLKGLVEKLKKAPHSLLREIYSVEEFSGVSFLVEEYVVGPLLQELLRARGTLSPPEVTKLLTSLAGLADHATKNGLQEVELTIATVQLATSDRDQHDGRPDMLRVPLTDQESLKLKVGVTNKILQLCGAKSYAQAATVVAGVSETVVDAAPPVSHLRQLSLLGYELLGGRANLIDLSRRPPPIAALTEAANQVLRDGIKGEFSSATEMAEKLNRCVKEMGVVPRPGPVPPPQPQPAPPPPARPVKPPRRLARWMVVALLLSIVVGAAIYYFDPQLLGTAKPVVEAKRYLDKKEFAKALPLLQKAADSGDAEAMNLLGTLYENGNGVTQDYGKAREWYKKAADAGNTAAKEALTRLPLLVPDNYASIQAAINAAMPGGTVRVRAGRYNEALQFKEGITLEGEGREGTVIHFASAPARIGQSHYQAPLEVRNCRSGTVRKLTFLQDQSDASGNALKIDVVMIFDSSVTIEECQVTSSASSGIGVYGSRSAPQILRNQCRSNARDGIYFGDGAEGTAQGNVCEKNSEDGIEVSGQGANPLVKDNKCSANKLSGIRVRHGSKATIQENICEGNQQNGIAVNHTGTSPQLRKNQCRSNVLQGIYFNEGAQGSAQDNVCEGNKQSGILAVNKSTSPELTTNQCRSNTLDGICFSDGAQGTARGNICEKNVEDGIEVWGEGSSPMLQENKCTANKLSGIRLRSASKGTVQGNECEGNDTGIYVSNKGTNPELTNNLCSANTSVGIYFSDGAQGGAHENICAKNEYSGIGINAASPALYRNSLKFNKWYGLAYNESAKPDLKEPQTYEGNERGEVNSHVQWAPSSTPTPTPSPTAAPRPTATAMPTASSSALPFIFPPDEIEKSTIDITNVESTRTLLGVSFVISYTAKPGTLSILVGPFKMTLYLGPGLTYADTVSKGKAAASTTASQGFGESGTVNLFVPESEFPAVTSYAISCSQSGQILPTTGKHSGLLISGHTVPGK